MTLLLRNGVGYDVCRASIAMDKGVGNEMKEEKEQLRSIQAASRGHRIRDYAVGSSRYRRARRIGTTPIFVGFVVLVVTITLAPPASASQVQTASKQTVAPSAGGNNTTQPLVVPGNYVTFTCTHGTISLGGTQYCSHTTTAPIDLCDSSSCQFSMTGTVDSGYNFYGWVVGGNYASVQCGTCLSTTLTLTVPNLSDRYSTSVNLDTTAPPPPTPVTITVATFENFSTEWMPADVQVCLGNQCSNATNGERTTLDQGQTYNVTAIRLPGQVYVFQWTTNAGYLSNTTNNPISFTPERSGTLSLITKLRAGNLAGYVYSPSPPVPMMQATLSNCFGGGNCVGPQGTTNGSGKTCVVSSFSETAGDFMYVAINYLGSTKVITSVTDNGTDTFTYIGGEFATGQSVALYDVASEHGGTVTITVTLSTTAFGTCQVGQLTAGATVGVVGPGGTANSVTDTSLNVTNTATHEPSLLLALFGSTRPSGPWKPPSPSGSWITDGFQETGYNPGTNTELIGYNDTASGTVTFTQTLENSGYDIYLSGIVVEVYIPGSARTVSSVSALIQVPASTSTGFEVWVGIGGLSTTGHNVLNLWQAGFQFNATRTGAPPYVWWEACYASSNGLCGSASVLVSNYAFKIQSLDNLLITVASSGGLCTSSIRDLSAPGKPYWNASYPSFQPYAESAEWALEPLGSSVSATSIPMSNITINGVFPTLYASYLNLWDPSINWLGTFVSAGTPNFSIYYL